MGALGALVAGLAVGLIGDRPTLIGAVIVFAAAALTVALSPLRQASSRSSVDIEAPPLSPEEPRSAGDRS
jgi:MFS family permease